MGRGDVQWTRMTRNGPKTAGLHFLQACFSMVQQLMPEILQLVVATFITMIPWRGPEGCLKMSQGSMHFQSGRMTPARGGSTQQGMEWLVHAPSVKAKKIAFDGF